MFPKTYSFKDVTVVLAHPLVGGFSSSGEVGLGEVMVAMAQERTAHDVAADATVMVSYLAGDNGTVQLTVQQTSDVHEFLLAWYNAIKLAADGGDVTQWATMTITIRSLTDGTQHVCQGVSPGKIPDKAYAAAGQRFPWHLMAADIQTVTISA